jgi:hypothetical protein
MKRSVAIPVAIGACVALVAAGVGAWAISSTGGGGGAGALAAQTPAEVSGFATLRLNPPFSQKDDLIRVLATLAPDEFDEDDDFETLQVNLLESTFEFANLNYEDDVEPWIGDEIAFVVAAESANDAAVGAIGFIVACTDCDQAVELLEDAKDDACDEAENDFEASSYCYEVVELDGAVMLAFDDVYNDDDDGLLQDMVDNSEQSLAENEDYANLVAELGDDQLALAYVDVPALLKEFEVEENLDAEFGPLISLYARLSGYGPFVGYDPDANEIASTPIAFGVKADGSSLVSKAVGFAIDEEFAPTGSPELARNLPDDTVAVYVGFDLASLIRDGEAAYESVSGFFGELSEDCYFDEFDEYVCDPVETQSLSDVVRDEFGLDLEDDLYPWLDGEFLFVLGDEADEDENGSAIPTEFAFVVAVDDVDAAEDAFNTLADRFSEDDLTEDFDFDNALQALRFTEEVEGLQPVFVLLEDRLILASSQDYAEALVSGSTDLLEKAGVGDGEVSAGYVIVGEAAEKLATALEDIDGGSDEAIDIFAEIKILSSVTTVDGALAQAEGRVTLR